MSLRNCFSPPFAFFFVMVFLCHGWITDNYGLISHWWSCCLWHHLHVSALCVHRICLLLSFLVVWTNFATKRISLIGILGSLLVPFCCERWFIIGTFFCSTHFLFFCFCVYCTTRGGDIAPPPSNRDNAARCELADKTVEFAIGVPSEGGKLVSTDMVVSTTEGIMVERMVEERQHFQFSPFFCPPLACPGINDTCCWDDDVGGVHTLVVSSGNCMKYGMLIRSSRRVDKWVSFLRIDGWKMGSTRFCLSYSLLWWWLTNEKTICLASWFLIPCLF